MPQQPSLLRTRVKRGGCTFKGGCLLYLPPRASALKKDVFSRDFFARKPLGIVSLIFFHSGALSYTEEERRGKIYRAERDAAASASCMRMWRNCFNSMRSFMNSYAGISAKQRMQRHSSFTYPSCPSTWSVGFT